MKSHVDLKWTSQKDIFGNEFIKYQALKMYFRSKTAQPANNGDSDVINVPNKPQVLQF